jgi:uncharacterized protein
MILSVFTRFLFAAFLGAGMLFVSAEPGAAQRDDGFFFLRDPFGQNYRPPPPAFPREQLPRRQAAPPEPTGGTIYGSAEAADRHRATQAEQYVVVMGDSLADQLAQGLADAFFEERPEIAIVKKTRGSSGLVRADFYDWPAEAPGLIENEKVNAIVIMLGANDRQVLRDEKGAYEIRSDRWRELYAARIDALIESLRPRGVPIIVTGQPSMGNARLHADMPYINEILRERAQAMGAIYVDVWDGFVNENDQFITMGSALDGQTRRLRMGDGVHFSRAGARKVAHYVERDLIRLFDQRGGVPVIPLDGPESTPSGRPIAGPVLPLTQPAGPVGELAGGGAPSSGNGNGDSTATRVLVEGLPVEPVAGRADDFRWPRSEVKIAPYEPPVAPKVAEPAETEKSAAVPTQGQAMERPRQSPKQSGSGQLPTNHAFEERSADHFRSGSAARAVITPPAAIRVMREEPGRRSFPCGSRTRARAVTTLGHRGRLLAPIRNSSTERAAWRPSRIAQTTSDWPRRMSPAANTFGTDV